MTVIMTFMTARNCLVSTAPNLFAAITLEIRTVRQFLAKCRVSFLLFLVDHQEIAKQSKMKYLLDFYKWIESILGLEDIIKSIQKLI